MKDVLERIAIALERIASHLDGDAVESIITVTPGPFTWDDQAGGFVHDVQDVQDTPKTAQTTWDWLGVTPSKPGRPAGRTSHCGRCGRADTRRMNHSDSCRECVDEPWWTE